MTAFTTPTLRAPTARGPRRATRTLVYATLLASLVIVFTLRTLAQLLQLLAPVDWLPAFERWHSGVLPYSALLAAQLLIVCGMTRLVLRIARGRIVPRRSTARIWLTLGALYATLMLVRLTLGATVLMTQAWFTSHISTIFHLVLAGFVVAVGRFHRGDTTRSTT